MINQKNKHIKYIFAILSPFVLSGSVLLSCVDGELAAEDVAAAIPPDEAILVDAKNSIKDNLKLLKLFTVEHDVKYEYPPPDDGLVRRASEKWMTVLSNGLYYQRGEMTRTNSAEQTTMENSFDVSIFYFGSPGQNHAILTKLLGDNPHDDMASTTHTADLYLSSVGFPLPETIGKWRDSNRLHSYLLNTLTAGRLLTAQQSGSDLNITVEYPDPVVLMAGEVDLDRLSSLGGGDGLAKEFAEVRSRNRLRIAKVTLDSEKGYALTRREERTPDGQPIAMTECHDFELVHPDGLWLPQTCITQYFFRSPETLHGPRDTPASTLTVKLRRLSFAIPEKTSFSLSYGPPATISDRSLLASKDDPTGSITYEMPLPNGLLRTVAMEKVSPTSSRNLKWIIIANLCVLLGLGSFFVVRRRTAS